MERSCSRHFEIKTQKNSIMRIALIFFTIIITSCSFDKKSGIWKDGSSLENSKDRKFSEFQKLYTEKKLFNKKVSPNKNLKLELGPLINNNIWADEFYRENNNTENFKYTNLNKLIFKSKKLSRGNIKKDLLFDGYNFIASDDRGNIIIYSLVEEKISYKFNFYKKKAKKIKKKLNIIAKDGIIYVSDNLGYLYAINLQDKKVFWAKNYKIPFRSNIKVIANSIIVTDINNSIYFINKFNGEKIKSIPTEESPVKNQFINSIAHNGETMFILNTYGSIYSINKRSKINWFVNINSSVDIKSNNLFNSSPLIIHENKMIISTDKMLYVLDSDNGTQIFKKAIDSVVKPIVSGKNIFLVTRDNLLVCIDLNTGKIFYSVDLNQQVANYLENKKRNLSIREIALLNNQVTVFLNNSYYLQINKIGNLQNIKKLPTKLNSSPIFVNESIVYVNNQNKLSFVN